MRDDTAPARAGRLRVILADIETLWFATYDEHPTTRAAAHTPPASKPPVALAPLSARQHATRRLAELVALVAEGRGIPTRLTLVNGAPRLASWLSEHADWIVDQADLAWRVYDLTEIARDVRAVAEPRGIRRAKIGPCPHCAGQLIAWIDDEKELPGRIVCDRDGHTWDRDHWRHLGRVLDPTPDLLDATQLAEWLTHRFLTRVEPATVWQWARREHITPVPPDNAEGDGGRPLYDRTTVADWYLEHRARRAG